MILKEQLKKLPGLKFQAASLFKFLMPNKTLIGVTGFDVVGVHKEIMAFFHAYNGIEIVFFNFNNLILHP